MDNAKKAALAAIDEKNELIAEVADSIWDYAELSMQEVKSAALFVKVLKAEGFQVEEGICGIPTAFSASFGSGGPVIGLLAEYDALSGLSQAAGSTAYHELVKGGSGHGCGHNLLGAASLAAAIAVKRMLQRKGLPSIIRYYGCPRDEGSSGKAFMARDGVFDDIDAAITWHPFGANGVMSISMLANYQIAYRFKGRSAHAAAAPHLGRSALDAVELMNVGVNYLRERIIQEARVHDAVTNTGGRSPNVVQAEAEVLYLIRAPRLPEVAEIYERINNIARGAALMTGTEVDILFDKACSNYIPNRVLGKIAYDNFVEVGPPPFDDADREFARAIRATLSENDLASDASLTRSFMGGPDPDGIVKKCGEAVLFEGILPFSERTALLPGSTDVGDVSWIAPTVQIATTCLAFGTPPHSWQLVAQGVMPAAAKGMLTAAKVMARTAIDVMAKPESVSKARAELEESLGGMKYVCPIPKGVLPKMA